MKKCGVEIIMKNKTIEANGTEIRVIGDIVNEEAYISLTDIAVVKDGAGVGRTTLHPAKSSVIGTMQYLLPKENVLPEYLYYVVRYMHLEKYFTGATIPHIYFKDYKNEEFNLDTIDRQTEIVHILKKVENIMEFHRQELEKLDELIKARFVEMFGDPVINNKDWSTDKLKAVTSKIGSGATPRGGKESYQGEGISLIRSMNVHDGEFEYKDLAHITDEQADQLSNVVVEPHDVFINITGASVARSCVVPDDVLPARVNQHVCIIRCLCDELDYTFAIVSYMLLLIALFIYFELFEDHFKKIILKNLLDKFLDFFYRLCGQYAFLTYTLALVISSNYVIDYLGQNTKLAMHFLGGIFLYLSCANTSKEKYIVSSFDEMKKTIDKVCGYRQFLDIKEPLRDPECILIIEDKNYFIREERYTFLNQYYLQERYWLKLKNYMFTFLQISNRIEWIKQALRGYSTIEMQLLRTLAIKEGYHFIVRRKIFEICYARIFLKNLKKYYKECDCSVEQFKYYLLYIYVRIAPCLNKGGEERLDEILGKKREVISSFSREELFALTLCFSGKIKRLNILQIYEEEIMQLNLDRIRLQELVYQLQQNT